MGIGEALHSKNSGRSDISLMFFLFCNPHLNVFVFKCRPVIIPVVSLIGRNSVFQNKGKFTRNGFIFTYRYQFGVCIKACVSPGIDRENVFSRWNRFAVIPEVKVTGFSLRKELRRLLCQRVHRCNKKTVSVFHCHLRIKSQRMVRLFSSQIVFPSSPECIPSSGELPEIIAQNTSCIGGQPQILHSCFTDDVGSGADSLVDIAFNESLQTLLCQPGVFSFSDFL